MPNAYSSDQPIQKDDEDLLNRASFAERIAEVLSSVPYGDNLVVGIHGPWGNGKTSVLNMIRKRLSQAPSLVCRDFNPWRLSNEEKIIRGFITMLASALGQSLETRSEKGWRIFRKAKPLEELATKIPGYGELLTVVLKGLDKIAKTGDDLGLVELRDRLEKVLKSASNRIVIIIDDIDRLDSEEIHILFKLIKACANLPNVSYLLAFDDLAVANTLNKRYSAAVEEEAGRAFLEKIIQIPLKLPHAQPSDLRLICLQDIERVLNETETRLTKDEVTRYVTYFDRSFLYKLTNPRVGKRYANSLRFALPMLRGEVNTVDLLLIEAIRSFFPLVYDIIRENQAAFHGVEGASVREAESRAIQLLRECMDSLAVWNQEQLQAILSELFPRLAPGYKKGGYRSEESLESYAKEKRICSPEYCPRYFSYTIPNSDVADYTIESIIKSAIEGQNQTVKYLVERNMEASRARAFISKLRMIEREIDPSAVRLICLTIASRADLLPNINGFMNFNNPPMQAGILISHLIRRIEDVDGRYRLAAEVVKEAEPLWFALEVIRWLYVTDKPEKQDQNTLMINQIELLKDILINRIKLASAAGSPLFDPEVSQEAYLLTEWAMKEGRDVVQRHLQLVFEKNTSQVARFLESMASKSWSMTDGLPSPPMIMADHLKRIASLFDTDILAQIVMGTCRGNFTNPTQYPDSNRPLDEQLAEQFIYLVKKSRESQTE